MATQHQHHARPAHSLYPLARCAVSDQRTCSSPRVIERASMSSRRPGVLFCTCDASKSLRTVTMHVHMNKSRLYARPACYFVNTSLNVGRTEEHENRWRENKRGQSGARSRDEAARLAREWPRTIFSTLTKDHHHSLSNRPSSWRACRISTCMSTCHLCDTVTDIVSNQLCGPVNPINQFRLKVFSWPTIARTLD